VQPVGELVRLGPERLGGLPVTPSSCSSWRSSVRSRMVVTEPTVLVRARRPACG
jgi:hypothetical protein